MDKIKIKVYPGVEVEKWRFSIAPTLEVTTCIPPKGCVVDCVFCPQRLLEKMYKGDPILTLDNFKRLIDKVPSEIRITFAGFTEPWMNRHCSDMVLYAHEQGHPVSIFTTGIGMTIKDFEKIKHIPWAPNPNGGFILHLPDQERHAKHPLTKGYIELLNHIYKEQHHIHNFWTMAMGPVHECASHLFPNTMIGEMWARAGNLVRESIMKPELMNLKDSYKSIHHGNQPMTCNCDERLYHNVLLPNGDISLCCMDYGLDKILGNLYEQEYDAILPDPYTTFDMCQGCENAIHRDHPKIVEEKKAYGIME